MGMLAAKTRNGRPVVKGFSWFNENGAGGTYNLEMFHPDGRVNELGEAYIRGCSKWEAAQAGWHARAGVGWQFTGKRWLRVSHAAGCRGVLLKLTSGATEHDLHSIRCLIGMLTAACLFDSYHKRRPMPRTPLASP